MEIFKCKQVKTPTRGTNQSAGIDFFVPDTCHRIAIMPGQGVNIPSGIHVKIPKGYALIAMNKSGVAVKKGLQVGACVIDEDYQGEIHLHLVNIGNQMMYIEPGEKIVQMLLIPVSYDGIELCSSLEDLYGGETTERGSGGFGSTGTK